MFDLVTIGHFVLDYIVSPRIAYPSVTLGGPPTFVSLAACKMGAKVRVVSKVGRDFGEYFPRLRAASVDLSHVKVVEDAFTTSFALTYHNDKRGLQLKNKAPQILVEDVPPSLRAKAIHVAPVANEVPMGIFERLRRRPSLLCVDPQGFLREFDKKGYAKLKKPKNSSFLRHCDIFKASLQEIKAMTECTELRVCMEKIREFGVKIVLVTLGRKGVAALLGGEFYHIPACKAKVVIDPTGAGDAFIGTFLAEYVSGKEPLWCCCVGSAAASFVVEEVGSERFGNRDEVYERATEIYEKRIKPLSKRFAA